MLVRRHVPGSAPPQVQLFEDCLEQGVWRVDPGFAIGTLNESEAADSGGEEVAKARDLVCWTGHGRSALTVTAKPGRWFVGVDADDADVTRGGRRRGSIPVAPSSPHMSQSGRSPAAIF